jgi:ribosomal protein S27AE
MNGGIVAGDPECPRCDASNWNEDGRLSCDECGYTPRASVAESIREELNR